MTTSALLSVSTTRFKNLSPADGHAFKQLNVLIGPNGSGKTNGIGLLRFLKYCIAAPADDRAFGAQLTSAAGMLGGARMLDRTLKYPGKIALVYELEPPPELQDRWESLRLKLSLYAHSPESPVSICYEDLSSTSLLHETPYHYYVFHDQELGRGVVSYYDAPETRRSHFERIDNVPTDALGLAILPELIEAFPHPPDMTPVYAVRRQLTDYIKKWHFYNANDMNFEEIRTSEPKIGPSGRDSWD